MTRDNIERRQDIAHILHSELLAHMKEEEKTFRQLRIDIKCMHDSIIEYKPYLDMAIKRECRRERFQRAVILHTTKGLILAGIIGLAWLLWDGIVSNFNMLKIK